MTELKSKKDALAKLSAARSDIETVLQGSAPAARYDRPLLGYRTRNALSVVCSDLAKIICELEQEQ